ncbi:MAG: MbcA/ParS/Xre antitoxin family protein [Hyphomonadaceae bacterium]|nr:MbcA/ParS/Xre antitoxin family protein [Hyphomonadaceae bacterium]
MSNVPDRAMGPFVCLDCGEVVSLRRPKDRRAHFTHRPDSMCVGETALHRYAKELLAREKTLSVPRLSVSGEGVEEVICEAGVHVFASVDVERAVDSFQPDAIAYLQNTKLAVEFLVTHAVDATKKAKVASGDMSMIEVDLSPVRAGRLDGAALDQAILHSAPRRWVHHRRSADVEATVRAKVDAKRADRGRRLAGHIGRKRRASAPAGWRSVAKQGVAEAKLEAHVGLDVIGQHWFAVSPVAWQTEALFTHVVKPSQLYSPGSALRVASSWEARGDLSRALPPWMIRQDLSDYAADRLAEAGFDQVNFASPHAAVANYFAQLVDRGLLTYNVEERSFYIAAALHGRLHRASETKSRVILLLEAAGNANAERACSEWRRTVLDAGLSPDEMIDTGGAAYSAMQERLAALRKMERGHSRFVTDDLCGLPVESLRDLHVSRIAREDEERCRRQQEAKVERIVRMQRLADAGLGGDAAAWLARTVEGRTETLLDWAGEGDQQFGDIRRLLERECDDRERKNERARAVAALQQKLVSAAEHAFRDPEKARVFLNASHPSLGGQRPLEYCSNQHALQHVMRMLPRR